MYLFLVLATAGFLLLGQFVPSANSLCENLAAGSIWSLFTVMVIDQISTIQIESQKKIVKFLSYKDAVRAVLASLKIWSSLTAAFGQDILKENPDIDQFESEFATKLADNLDLKSHCPEGTTWVKFLVFQTSQIQKFLEKSMRYDNFLEPDMIFALGELDDVDFIAMVKLIEHDQDLGVALENRLADFIDAVVQLQYQIKLQEKEFEHLTGFIAVPDIKTNAWKNDVTLTS